jgi:hypothetical protein
MEEAATLTLSPGPFASSGLSHGGRRATPGSEPLAQTTSPDIDGDQGAGPSCVMFKARMGNVIFKCPRTGMNVQRWLADESPSGNARGRYESVTCKACSGLHFIDRSSRKLLGEQENSSRPRWSPDRPRPCLEAPLRSSPLPLLKSSFKGTPTALLRIAFWKNQVPLFRIMH